MQLQIKTALCKQARGKRGMTLVEVIVSLAIIVVVATVVIGVFVSTLKFQEVARERADDAVSVEEQIAALQNPSQTQALPGGGITLGGYLLPSQAQTFSDGTGSFTVLDGTTAPQVSVWQFGDGAPTGGGSINTGAGGSAGTSLPFTALGAGKYRIQLWGAQGNGSGSDAAWHGAYVSFEITLQKNDALKLEVGGLAEAGKNGGNTKITLADNSQLAVAGGGDGQGGQTQTSVDASISNPQTIFGLAQMPDPLNPTGSTITGKSGGGYICITWLWQ